MGFPIGSTKVSTAGPSFEARLITFFLSIEEILNDNYALWWSPDATHLAYLRLDETDVPELHLPIYTTDNDSYPDEISLRYPKVSCYLYFSLDLHT
jgi:dipeptidyl aminopeptidase